VTARLYDAYGKETFYTQNIEILQNYAPEYYNLYTNYTIYALQYFEVDLYTIFYDNNSEDLHFTHC
jgi:hypothetical protein